MPTKTYIITTALSILSTAIALILSIYAIAYEKYWIPIAMLVFGIAGVILTAYIRTRKRR